MRARNIVLTVVALGVGAGLTLRFAPSHEQAKAREAKHELGRNTTPHEVTPPPSGMPVSANELHELLAQAPEEPVENLSPEERSAREQIAKPVEQQPLDVQRTYYRAQLEASPRALRELARSVNEARQKLGEDSAAYAELSKQLAAYSARVEEAKQKLAALN
jgi:hypothetical protein